MNIDVYSIVFHILIARVKYNYKMNIYSYL